MGNACARRRAATGPLTIFLYAAPTGSAWLPERPTAMTQHCLIKSGSEKPGDLHPGPQSPMQSGATGGHGLDLAFTRAIVVAHGGTVSAHNRPSGGACVIVTLERPAR